MRSRPTNNRITQQGSEAAGARDGCSSVGDESMAEPGATGERKPPLAPGAPELLHFQGPLDGPGDYNHCTGKATLPLPKSHLVFPKKPLSLSQIELFCPLTERVKGLNQTSNGRYGPLEASALEGPGGPPQQFSGDPPRTAQVQGLEPPRVPVEGRGENGGWGEGSQDSEALLPQDTAARGSTEALETHVCANPRQNECLRRRHVINAVQTPSLTNRGSERTTEERKE